MFCFTDDNPDFYIQLKGENAGRPLNEKMPNSVGIKTDPKLLVSGFLFYTVLYLFQTGIFRRYLRGSVIPFITQRDISHVIISHFTNLNLK